jgi:hypothetical protein
MKIDLLGEDQFETVFLEQERLRRAVLTSQIRCASFQLRQIPRLMAEELQQFKDPDAVRRLWCDQWLNPDLELLGAERFARDLKRLPLSGAGADPEIYNLTQGLILTQNLYPYRLGRLGLLDVGPLLKEAVRELFDKQIPSAEGCRNNPQLARKTWENFRGPALAYREQRHVQSLLELLDPEPEMDGTPRQPMPNRRFGIELEGFLPSLASREEQREYLFSNLEEAGFPVQRQLTPPGKEPWGWAVKDDETIFSPFIHRGHRILFDTWQPHYFERYTPKMLHNVSLEIVTPPLLGEDGLEELRRGCELLHQLGMRANWTCKTHVHVEMPGRQIEEARNLGAWFMEKEADLDMHLHPNVCGIDGIMSRSNNAQYYGGLAHASTLKEMVHLVSPDRFHKLNFTNLDDPAGEPTCEWRGRQGGFDPLATTNYASMVVACTDAAAKGENPQVPAYQSERPDSVRDRLPRPVHSRINNPHPLARAATI